MNIGMLWFDNDPKVEFNLKIERAAHYYHEKYGCAPNVCYVHPSMLGNGHSKDEPPALKSGDIVVRISRSVLPNHFWIGVNGSAKFES
jgi:hypothetical protein